MCNWIILGAIISHISNLPAERPYSLRAPKNNRQGIAADVAAASSRTSTF